MPKRKEAETSEVNSNHYLQSAIESMKLMRGSDDFFSIAKIPTGIYMLDKLTAGGFPRRKFSILWGAYGQGKSVLLLKFIANAQKLGHSCVYIDTETNYDREWAIRLGVDVNKLCVANFAYFQDAIKMVIDMFKEGVDVIAIDSLSGLTPKEMIDAPTDKTMGLRSRLFSDTLPAVMAANTNTVLIGTNQMRHSIGGRFNPGVDKNMPGGEALRHYAHLIVEISRKGWLTEKQDEEEKISAKRRAFGFNIECFVDRTKIFGVPPHGSCIIPFNESTGEVDELSAIIDMAMGEGAIISKGPWYYYGEERIQGKQGLLDWFSDGKRLKDLKDKLSA